ncbi:hypothetical protein CCACVL1_18224 [Corchorus capsularis]|uniref:Uncharacterized protein n=1 Tax=Corchorus capsularis TaxID=210143 RepID=A0A1R3HLW4_COCAP|nr:hypothetical protein CCACVL1_18224 [Corchorus capsularis]
MALNRSSQVPLVANRLREDSFCKIIVFARWNLSCRNILSLQCGSSKVVSNCFHVTLISLKPVDKCVMAEQL